MSALADVVHQALPRLWAISSQVLGHLVESGCDNHAPWGRVMTQDSLTFPTWDQDAWNTVQDWQQGPWPELLAHDERHLDPHLEQIRERVAAP